MWIDTLRRRLRVGSALLAVMLMLGGTLLLQPSTLALTTVPVTPTPEGGAPSDEAGGEVAVELPPPDLPTANEEGYTFDIDVSLSADLDALAKEAPVYELRRSEPTLQSAQELADALKVEAQVSDRGDGTFEANGKGQLFVSADLIQYFSPTPSAEGDLPADDEAVVLGREWLRVAGLLPPDLGEGRVANRSDETRRMVVTFGPAEPSAVLAGYPSISVTVGPEGAVIEASLRWARVVRSDVYQLMPAEQAWQTVESGQAYIDADLARAELEPGSDVTGRATFESISIAYSTSGPPGGQQYLQPIYVFQGKMRVDDKDGSFVVKAYVPALANSGAPVGLLGGQGRS